MTVYILRSEATQRYYVGASDDTELRVRQHNEIVPNPGRWTRGRGPWRLVYARRFHSKREALQAERFIKRMKSRAFIEKLIGGEYELGEILKRRARI